MFLGKASNKLVLKVVSNFITETALRSKWTPSFLDKYEYYFMQINTTVLSPLFHFRVFSRKWLVGIGNVLARIVGDNGLRIKWLRKRAKRFVESFSHYVSRRF